jgi:hypothetical protein
MRSHSISPPSLIPGSPVPPAHISASYTLRESYQSSSADARKPRYHLYSYSPLEPFPPLFPVHSPFTTPSPSHIQHRWRAYHLRQPAWRSLADWLEDLRGRVAWAQVKFALVDDELELAGAKSKPLSTASDQHKLRSR